MLLGQRNPLSQCSSKRRIQLCRLVSAIIIFISFAAAPPAISLPNQHLKISSSIRSHTSSEMLKVWVLFTDKGFSTSSDQRRAIDQYQAQMSNRAKYRRELRAELSRPDFADLPIESRYIDAVLRSGAKLRSESRWLNGVGLEATSQAIREIACMPFVRAIDPIRQHTRLFKVPTSGSVSPSAPSSAKVLDYGNAETQITQIQADFLHQEGFLGEKVVIGLLDTGFNLEHTALERVDVIAQYDFVNDDANTADETDQDDPNQDDHGSAVLGILAGDALGRLIGVAPRGPLPPWKTEKVSQQGVVFERQIEEDWWV